MLRNDAEQLLQEYAATAYPQAFREVCPGIFHVVGYGHSNVIVIEADHSVILIDTLDSDVRAERLRDLIAEKINKPVKTIIFTHGHPDHRGGSAAFADFAPEVIAFAPAKAPLGRMDVLQPLFAKRTARQFGYALSDEELITQGLGIREGFAAGEGKYDFLPATTVYTEPVIRRTIDGVALELVATPGEADDEILVWLPEHKVLCSADTYYPAWPNLYAIRGSQYRDVSDWIASLDKLLSYPAEYLLPGHTSAIVGAEKVAEVLTNYRNAVDYVLQETLVGMSEGKSADELAESIALPAHLANLPYLREHYGTIAWSVRGIYAGYIGWFDGNPTALNPLPRQIAAKRTIALMGGEAHVLVAAEAALAEKEYQWACELVDLLNTYAPNAAANMIKVAALRGLAPLEVSANGRHYYMVYANELARGEV